MGYRNFFKRNISSPTSKRNKPVLFIFMIKLLNAVSIQRIFSLFSHNDRVKWISISFFLMLIWRRIFLFFFSISISKKRAQYFNTLNERRSKLMFTQEECLLCILFIFKQSWRKCVVSCHLVSLPHFTLKKCVDVH